MSDKNENGYSQHVLLNPSGYKVLICIGMIYMSIMLCNAILTNRYIGNDSIFVLGGTFTSPLVFILDNIIAEIYGYKITRYMIFMGFVSLTLFSVICQIVVASPYPHVFVHDRDYRYILGGSLLRIDISGFISYIAANLMNAYILTRWKYLLKGKKFWLRSIGSSTFSEAFYSVSAILMMEISRIPFGNILKIIVVSFLIKAFYSIILAGPESFLVYKIKKYTGIDIYDLPKEFTPEGSLKKI